MAKILQILPALNSGGVERTTLEMVQAIKSVGWQPFVASSGGRMMFEIERAGARHLTLPLQSKSPFVMQRNKNRLTKFIKAGGIDLVHARSRAPAWSARRAITKQDIPFVTTYHGIYSENGLFKRKYNAIMACGDIVIANSEFTKAHLLERHHKLIGDKPVKVVYRGVDLEKFTLEKVGAPRLTHISDQWGLEIEHDLPVFLLPGRITRIKGHDILIEAAAKLREEGHDFIIVCAGDFFDSDNYFGQLQRRVEKRKLQNIIRFVGHVEDMPAAMAAGDFVICASTQPEAFGRVMAEGLAMRRPVIASNHGGAKEIVGDGQSGYLVTPGDAAALAEAMSKMLSHSLERRAQMGEAGRRKVERHFTVDRLQRDTLMIYGELLGLQPDLDKLQVRSPRRITGELSHPSIGKMSEKEENDRDPTPKSEDKRADSEPVSDTMIDLTQHKP